MQSDIMLAIEHQNVRKQVFIVQVSSLFLVASAFLSFTGKCKRTLELLLAYYNRLNLKYNGSSLVFVFTVCLYFFTIFSQQQLRDFYHCPWLPKKLLLLFTSCVIVKRHSQELCLRLTLFLRISVFYHSFKERHIL